jgi:hypothetical protein
MPLKLRPHDAKTSQDSKGIKRIWMLERGLPAICGLRRHGFITTMSTDRNREIELNIGHSIKLGSVATYRISLDGLGEMITLIHDVQRA